MNFERDFADSTNADVLIDGDVIIRIVETSSYNDEAMSSSSTLVLCSANQQISIVSTAFSAVLGDQFPRSTFSVFLLFETGKSYSGTYIYIFFIMIKLQRIFWLCSAYLFYVGRSKLYNLQMDFHLFLQNCDLY